MGYYHYVCGIQRFVPGANGDHYIKRIPFGWFHVFLRDSIGDHQVYQSCRLVSLVLTGFKVAEKNPTNFSPNDVRHYNLKGVGSKIVKHMLHFLSPVFFLDQS